MMSVSVFFKIAIGLVIFLVASAYQIEELRKLAPSLEDFSQTTNISGAYSYEWYGRNVETQVDGKSLHCGVNYGGSHGSCFSPLKNIPKNSRITVDAANIRTSYGDVLYATSITVDGLEIYRKSPKQSLHDWWLDSCFEVIAFPLLLLAVYISVLVVFHKIRR
jgi:hypothetical protein